MFLAALVLGDGYCYDNFDECRIQCLSKADCYENLFSDTKLKYCCDHPIEEAATEIAVGLIIVVIAVPIVVIASIIFTICRCRKLKKERQQQQQVVVSTTQTG